MKLNYKNTEIFYSTKGIGNPIVFLHGFLESSEIWKPFVAELSKNRQVIIIDLPGHGQSGVIEEVHTMELMANTVYEVLQYLDITKASFIGHSMGGYVSLSFCEKHPEMINSLVLMNSTPEEDSEEKKENRERAVDLVRRNKPAYIKMAISNLLTPENNKKFKNETEKLKAEAMQFPEKGITAALQGMKIRTDKIEALKNFSGRKIIIAGKNDPVLEYNSLKNISLTCKTELKTLPDGHLSYLENFQEVSQTMYFID